MKKSLSLILAIIMMMSCSFGAASLAVSGFALDQSSVGTKSDTGTHECDYVVAANPSYSDTDRQSTGTLSVDEGVTHCRVPGESAIAYDVHPETDTEISEKIAAMAKSGKPATKATYAVGSKKNFNIIQNLNASSYNLVSVQFECLAAGTHCYIWTPVSGYYPLDSFSTSYAATVQSQFDANYEKMIDTFGEPYNPEDHGKINLMYYDLQDGATTSSSSYIAGYFWGADMYPQYNGAAMINIDTYPAITFNGFASTYSTMYHEFQHLINYSRTVVNGSGSEMGTWLNECMSSVAEELILPNSALTNRMSIWNNTSGYTSFHLGASLYDFTNNLDAYAIVCLFGQYMEIQTSDNDESVFSRIITNSAAGQSDAEAVEAAVSGTDLDGMTLAEINHAFRAAIVARSSDGIYGFHGDARFDTLQFKTLSQGSSGSIEGGGAIVYAVNGSFTEPSNAGELEYLYITGSDVEGATVPTECTLTFDPSNGDDPWQVVIPYNTVYAMPALPTAPDGAPCKGWYANGSLFDFSTSIKRNINFVAKYDRLIEIRTAEQFAAIENDLSGDYVLMSNIVFSGAIDRIGDETNIFTGTLNGNGYTVSGFTLGSTTESNIGLFAVNAGLIRNLRVILDTPSQVVGNVFVGAIAGQNIDVGTIAHCQVSVNAQLAMIAGTSADDGSGYLGAIAGANQGMIEYCNVTTTKSASIKASYCGGISGENTGTLKNCYSFIDPCGWASGVAVGGLCGLNAGTIIECCATGRAGYGQNYDTVSYVGGLVGYMDGSLIPEIPCKMIDCYYANFKAGEAFVCGNEYIGGLIGYTNECEVTNCYVYTANVEYYGSNYGLGIGYKDTNVAVTQSYTCGTTNAYGLTAGVTSWSALRNSATQWDWVNTWSADAYPFSLRHTDSSYRNSFTVTYASSITGAELPDAESYNYGDTFTVPSASIPGMRVQWWKSDDETITWTVGNIAEMVGYDITVNAGGQEAYSVSYDLDGGVGVAVGGEYLPGESFTLAAAPTKEGFVFQHWLYNNIAYNAGSTFTMTESEDIVFLAKYTEEIKYTVIFCDYDGTVLSTQRIANGKAAVAPNDPTRTGYTFIGWDKEYSNVTSDIIVTACYSINMYTVTFCDYDYTIIDVKNVQYGGSAEAPDAPTRTGYDFIGWDKDFSVVSEDIIVMAEYAIKTFTVRFVVHGNIVISTQTVEYGDGAVEPDNIPEWEGHEFTGWDKDFSVITSDLTVTAEYDALIYVVTFLGRDMTVLETERVEYGDDATPPEAPEIEGYDFVGWIGDYTNVTADVLIYADYDVKTFTVTFYGLFGDTIDTATVEYGNDATLPDAPTVVGYDFVGWSHDGTNITGDTEIYAEYMAKTFTVTFCDFFGDTIDTITVAYGGNATLPEAPTVEGYDFTGWSHDGKNIVENITITAEYSIKSFTFIFYDYDNSVLLTQIVEYGKAAIAPTDPTRENYEFVGWEGDYSCIKADSSAIAKYVAIPTVSLDDVRIYVSSNTDIVRKFAFAKGVHTTLESMVAAGIRAASTSKAFTATEAGDWTVYVLTTDGREYFTTYNIDKPVPEVTVLGADVFASSEKDDIVKFAYAYGEYETLDEMNDAGIIYENDAMSFTAQNPGDYTVYVRMSWGFVHFIHVAVSYETPTYNIVGSKVTATPNDLLVKFGYAIGEYTSYEDMRASGTLRLFSTSKRFYAPTTNTYTIYMRLDNGAEFFFVEDIEVHVPTLTQNEGVVSVSTYRDEVIKFGYKLGVYNSYSEFNTTGVRYASTSKRTVKLIAGETYTIYMLMNDGRQIFRQVTIETPLEPTFSITKSGAKFCVSADENKDEIVKMGYALGHYETKAEMDSNGSRYCSTSKRFYTLTAGEYTIYIAMSDGNTYMYHINVND